MKISKWGACAALALMVLLGLYTWKLSQPLFDARLDEDKLLRELHIAPLSEAITFAKLQTGEVILAVSANSAGIMGLNLNVDLGKPFADGIEVFNALGARTLRAKVKDAHDTHLYTWDKLAVPVKENYPHIAAGTNYREHADEVGHVGDPFVFPKLSHLTPWNASVPSGSRLDYELELCAIPLRDYTPGAPVKLGYLLCGDFTDRWLLIKQIDTSGPMGPTGFAAGKGGQGRFPVGSLLVIPETDEFYKKLELKLYLNGDLRQRTTSGQMIWSPQQILRNALSNCKVPYFSGNEQLNVTANCEYIPHGTVILTGTPGGVMFNIATLWNPFSYLRVGDEVVSSASYLGFMRNTITAAGELR